MKILAGIFYLFAFTGIMAVAHFVPATPPVPAKPAPEPEPGVGVGVAEIPEEKSVPVEEIVEAALQAESEKTEKEFNKLHSTISKNASEMATLNRKLAQITDTHLALKNENTRLAKRLAEVEARPVFVEEPAEPGNAANRLETPEGGTPFPKPENSRPLPRPTPGGISVSFALGSMDFSASALEILRKAADEMTQNEELFLSLRGSTSGFGTSLGKGRAEAVKSKLAEMGVTAERVSVSDQTQGNGDSVKLSFSNRLSS